MKYLILIILLMCGGCSQKIYDRATISIDPNGLVTAEHVHFGSTSIATDSKLNDLFIKNKDRVVSVGSEERETDDVSLSATHISGTKLAIDTKSD